MPIWLRSTWAEMISAKIRAVPSAKTSAGPRSGPALDASGTTASPEQVADAHQRGTHDEARGADHRVISPGCGSHRGDLTEKVVAFVRRRVTVLLLEPCCKSDRPAPFQEPVKEQEEKCATPRDGYASQIET